MMDRGLVDEAWQAAKGAGRGAQVQIRQVTGADVAAAQTVIGRAWGRQQIPQSNLLQALSHAGNTVLAADREGAAIGVAFGFLGWTGGIHLHSHMTAVTDGFQSRGVGYALKLWQRAVCLEHGVREMRWTYDPLIARNAYFNLVKLGAEANAFLPDFYGAMDDEINAGDHSDRFEVVWRLDSKRVTAALHRTPGHDQPPHSEGVRVPLPQDFDALRRQDPSAALKLRLSSRAQFTDYFTSGLRPNWVAGGYNFVLPAAESATAPVGSAGGRDG